MHNWKDLGGRNILLTGGTGSFGNAAVKKWLNSSVGKINILSRDEKKQEDMRKKFNDSRLSFFLGDVRDPSSIKKAIRDCEYVFHAAALKQVPSTEFFPMEAIKTNAIGADNVLEAAIDADVKKVVVLSTDKAVYPINAMGMTKALMEKLAISKTRYGDNDMSICITRYGNVMASRGSVIPLFISQIKDKRPLTITNPTMTRFMMSLDNAIELVNFAFTEGNTGDILVQKSPACTIQVLAEALIELFESKVDICNIGTRHGEKLYESLLSKEERIRATEHDQYFQVPIDNRELHYNTFENQGLTFNEEPKEYSSHNTIQLNKSQMKDLLLNIEYVREQLYA